MVGVDQPAVEVQVAVSMWSVWIFWDQISGESGGGMGRGVVVRVMVRAEARRGLRLRLRLGPGGGWGRAAWVSLVAVSVGVTDWERSGVGGKAVVVAEVG